MKSELLLQDVSEVKKSTPLKPTSTLLSSYLSPAVVSAVLLLSFPILFLVLNPMNSKNRFVTVYCLNYSVPTSSKFSVRFLKYHSCSY
jgi:hypothetical protein